MTEHKSNPKSVAIIGLGPSRQEYITEIACGRCDVPWEEVWVMNSGIMTFRHDLGFLIDDMRVVQKRFPHLTAAAMRSGKPIVTSTVYPEFPTAVPYPYDEITAAVGLPNIHCNSGPMSLAYALIRGVKKIFLYGFDYTYKNTKMSEFGGQALAFMMGMAGRFGAKVELPHTTSMLGNYYAKWRKTAEGIEMDWPHYGLVQNIEFYDSLVNIGEEDVQY